MGWLGRIDSVMDRLVVGASLGARLTMFMREAKNRPFLVWETWDRPPTGKVDFYLGDIK